MTTEDEPRTPITPEELRKVVNDAVEKVRNFTPEQLKLALNSGLLRQSDLDHILRKP